MHGVTRRKMAPEDLMVMLMMVKQGRRSTLRRKGRNREEMAVMAII
jgi:hypothetical protein